MNGKKIYLALQAILCILLVALLSAAAIEICQEGILRRASQPMEPIFTLQAVSERLSRLAPLIVISVLISAVGIFLGIKDEKRNQPFSDPVLKKNLLLSGSSVPGKEAVQAHKHPIPARWVGWALFGLCMVPVLVYLLSAEHFPEDNLEYMFASLAAVVFPWTGLGILCLCFVGMIEDRSALRKAEEMVSLQKSIPASGKDSLPRKRKKSFCSGSAVQGVLLLAAFVFILLGFLNGSLQDMLYKAINICTECIGLG